MNLSLSSRIKGPRGPLVCYLCNHTIISSEHRSSCNTVNMFQLFKSNYLSENFKSMMTYGLGGCTALIAINKSSGDIIFGHHPVLNQVLNWFDANYKESNNYIVIIKSPGEWVKINNEMWDLVSNNEQKLKTKFSKPNCDLILEPYSLIQKIDDDFQTTLYLIKKNKSLVYTNSYGVEKLLI